MRFELLKSQPSAIHGNGLRRRWIRSVAWKSFGFAVVLPLLASCGGGGGGSLSVGEGSELERLKCEGQVPESIEESDLDVSISLQLHPVDLESDDAGVKPSQRMTATVEIRNESTSPVAYSPDHFDGGAGFNVLALTDDRERLASVAYQETSASVGPAPTVPAGASVELPGNVGLSMCPQSDHEAPEELPEGPRDFVAVVRLRSASQEAGEFETYSSAPVSIVLPEPPAQR